jgi:FAD synthetase
MNLEKLVSKYIATAEQIFNELQVTNVCVNVDVDDAYEVLEFAEAYLKDARYYRDKGKFEVGLTSIAYCEGLLDALRLLGAVKFEWPAKRRLEE